LGDAPVFLKDLLIEEGVTITTFDGKLGTGMGISPDGKYICGFDNTAPVFFAAGWVVYLDIEMGISDMNSSDFAYYPNPVKDFLTIKSKKAVQSIDAFNLA